MAKNVYFIWLLCCFSVSCTEEPLPILGPIQEINGEVVHHSIPDFSFINQDSQWVTNQTFQGKHYLVDFFFLSCPTICPKVSKKMLEMYNKFQDEDKLLLLTHTIDPKRDSVTRLRAYAENLGASSEKWHFVTGSQDSLFAIADDYYSVAFADPDAPGGFNHTGRIILVDQDRHIRAYCNALNEEEVAQFYRDIETLLHEN